jgi:hypothetical protein
MGEPDEPQEQPGWHQGVFLTQEQYAALSPERQEQYRRNSWVRDFSEIDSYPEPWRTHIQGMADWGRARTLARIGEQEGPEAVESALRAIADAEGDQVRDRVVKRMAEQERREAS